MPEEIFALIIITMALGTGIAIASMIFAYLRDRNKTQATGNSMTSSELRHIIQDAVKDATDPLQARIEELEDQFKAPKQLEPRQPLLDLEDLDDEVEQPAPVRRRTR